MTLVGLPAVGKSTLGRRLARELGRTFVDTDALVEAQAGRSIADIFQLEGEARFRELEADALESVDRLGVPAVVSTGGGIVTSARSRDILMQRSFAVYLRSATAHLLPRLARTRHRPLFRSGDIAATLDRMQAERDPLYRAVARLTVDVDRLTPARIVARIGERCAASPTDVPEAMP